VLGRSGGSSGRGKNALKRALRDLEEQREEGLRHLGGLALEMNRRGEIDDGLLTARAAELAEIEREIESLTAEVSGQPGGGQASRQR